MRVKSGTRTKRRHKKVLELAKGYWMSRSKLFRKAKEATLHAGQYAYHGRKKKRRDIHSLWIMRINAAVRENGLTYSQFINQLKVKKVEIDRKILSQIAQDHPVIFKEIITSVK